MKRAVVVAHPDDETLWGARYIIRHQCDVICCSIPRRDPIRAYKFFEAVRILGGFPKLLPFPESGATEPLPHLSALDLAEYGEICTHNPMGEYGHVHHKQVSEHVRNAAVNGVVMFGYGMEARNITLSSEEASIKLAALQQYDHQSSSDTKPKWQALLDRYQVRLEIESYVES